VTNVVRHSGASLCSVRLSGDVARVMLEVHDDGRGSAAPPGLGLRDMRERVESIGGTMSIEATRGVRLLIDVPLAERDEVSASRVGGLGHAHAHGRRTAPLRDVAV
jgi:two-component system sensor histidine kinase DesK